MRRPDPGRKAKRASKKRSRRSPGRRTRERIVATCAAAGAGVALLLAPGCDDRSVTTDASPKVDLPRAKDSGTTDTPVYYILPPVLPPKADTGVKKDNPVYAIMPPQKDAGVKKDSTIYYILPPILPPKTDAGVKKDGTIYYILPPILPPKMDGGPKKKDGTIYYILPPPKKG
jgi:hypothetical protein